MSIFGENAPVVRARRKISPTGNIKSGIVFSVKGGLDRLSIKPADGGKNADPYSHYSVMQLDGTSLVQIENTECHTCADLLAAGYGIENTDCEELRRVSEAVNSDFIDIEHSFEILKPLFGLLRDGNYLLADAECIPTDGEGRFFWDIEPEMKVYGSAVSEYYMIEEEGCDILSYVSVEPVFLYPTQSAALFNRERAEYYREHDRNNENAPRAIAYNDMYGISALLDGHHKAAAAALEGQRVKCLLIIPGFENFFKPKDSDWRLYRQMFTDDIYFEPNDFTEKELADFKAEFLAKRGAVRIPPKFGISEPGLTLRKWEKEFTENAKKYPDIREYSLMKFFGADQSYPERVESLNSFLDKGTTIVNILSTDALGFMNNGEKIDICREILALKLMFKKAGCESDPSMKKAAYAVIREDYDFGLVCAAMNYLLNFREDKEVEKLFTDIISDGYKFDKYGHIALDLWEDEI